MTQFFKFCFILFLGCSTVASAQEKTSEEDNIKTIADKACECTRDISERLSKDSIVSAINGCIYAAVIENQTLAEDSRMKKLIDAAITAKNDTVVGSGETFTITVDKDFDKIQRYMHKNCVRTKMLMSVDNVERDFSMTKDKKALEYYNQGVELARHEQYERAIESYKKAVKTDSKFAFAWDNMGLCYRKNGKYKDAINCYKRSHEIDPVAPTPLMNMGVAYIMLEDYKSAAKTYDELIKIDPENPEGYYGAGKSYYVLDEYEKGLDNMFKAYRMYTEMNSPYINDAGKFIEMYYGDLNAKGKIDIFNRVAKNNNIEIK